MASSSVRAGAARGELPTSCTVSEVVDRERIERGHTRDLADVQAMQSHALTSAADVRAHFARMEPEF